MCKRFLFIIVFLLPASLFAQTYLNPDSSVHARVEDLLSRMSLDEKIGQMTQVNWPDLESPSDMKTWFIGSLLNGGGAVPIPNTAEAWVAKYNQFQQQALQTPLAIPFIWGTDAVHGHNNLTGAVIFPHNIGLGATRNEALVEEVARITALETAATGVDWTFAPCVAVPRDIRWGRTYEGFSENPELTGILGAASVRGLQGANLADSTSILSCTKHYVGDGGTTGGEDQGNTELTEAELREIHLTPYLHAINAGTGSIMASYNSWNGSKLHGNPYLLTDVLKTELGFEGFIVSDWAAIDQLPGEYIDDIEQSINAGIDMVMVPSNYKEFIAGLTTLVNQGKVSMDRINDANRRILRIKFMLGLFEQPLAHETFIPTIGSPEHRAVGRQAVRESLVLLKNKNLTLPLDENAAHIHVAGKSANDLGNQCGGWSITWQGQSGQITTGTTILQALQKRFTGKITFYKEGSSPSADGAQTAVVVIGETPYAEGAGDDRDLRLSGNDVQAVRSLHDQGFKVVTILVSGRPLILDDILHYSDAIIAAWLPGTEGDGVADILFGDHQLSGKLPYTWPASADQLPLNFGDPVYQPLYPYGYGIDTFALPAPEDPPVPLSAATTLNGAGIELTFDKPMDIPSPTNLQLEINATLVQITGISLKPGDENTLIISPSSTISGNDRLTISASGSLPARDGSLSQAFEIDVYNRLKDIQSIPGKIEAENYYDMLGIQTETTTDAGGGENVGYFDAGDYLVYQVYHPKEDLMLVQYRVASESTGGSFRLQIWENDGYRDVHPITFNPTGGWQNWTTKENLAVMPAGNYRIRILADSPGFNLNWIDFINITGTPESGMEKLRIYPNPATDRLRIELDAPEPAVYQLYNSLGILRSEGPFSHKTEVNITGMPGGIYFLKITDARGRVRSSTIVVE